MTAKIWKPSVWEYTSEDGLALTIQEPTASHCITFEKKAVVIGADSATDWLLSECVEFEGEPIDPLSGTESINMFDRLNIVSILRGYDKNLTPLDDRPALTSEYFRHTESGLAFTFTSPPFNQRVNELMELGQIELILYLVNNYTCIDNIPFSSLDLDNFPYLVGDIPVRHFSQKVARVPTKKKLS